MTNAYKTAVNEYMIQRGFEDADGNILLPFHDRVIRPSDPDYGQGTEDQVMRNADAAFAGVADEGYDRAVATSDALEPDGMSSHARSTRRKSNTAVEQIETGWKHAAARPAQTAPVVAVVLAAGFGTRFDPDNPKQLVSVGGKPIVCWSIEAFEHCGRVSDIVVVVNPKVRSAVESLIDDMGYTKVRVIIDGGAERVDSTAAALDTLAAAGIPDDAKILIHDAVRPFVEQSSIEGSIDALDQFTAATVAYASTDTVLLTEDLGDVKVVKSVPDRPNTFRAQTPQSFRFATIRRAYELAASDPDFHPTDDTRVVVDYLPDEPVAIVSGSETNLKITTLEDVPTAEHIAEEIQGRDPKEEARARMHALLAQAAGQMR